MSYSVAIDGPAGSGKSTVAKEVAKRLRILYVDTGAMYRGVAYFCIKNGIDTKNEKFVEKALNEISLDIRQCGNGQLIFLNNQDITKEIRSQDIGRGASDVASILIVREKLVEIQRSLAEGNDVIMDGRDIGTNVLKTAQVKIYLNASPNKRAKRRLSELLDLGKIADFSVVKNEILERDYADATRKYNPLKKAIDAIEIDTSNMTIEDAILQVLDIINKKIKK